MSVHAGSIWIDQNFNRLPQGLWIAADATHLVEEDSDLTRLMARLRQRQVPLADLTLTYLPDGTFQ